MRIDWDRLRTAVGEQLDDGTVPGAVLAVSLGGEVQVEPLGRSSFDSDDKISGDAVVRISSMTKPVVAALTMILVDDGVLGVTDPVERWIPELAGRKVLRNVAGPPGDVVPAERPITVDDLLTMRMGFGFVMDSPCPTVDLAAAAGLGIGPPDPSNPLTPDEWAARFGELPLLHQPGAEWMYDLSYAVLGILVARAGGQPLDELLQSRLLEPLGMRDTGFAVPAHARDRLIPCYSDGEVFDSARTSRWLVRPSFPDARGGLVSTAADYLRFARMLLAGGVADDGTRLLFAESVRSLTSDQLAPDRRRSFSESIFLSGGGWGYGVEVVADPVARYGWGGGLGTTWYSYPEQDLAAVLITQCLPPPEALVNAFWDAVHSSVLGTD